MQADERVLRDLSIYRTMTRGEAEALMDLLLATRDRFLGVTEHICSSLPDPSPVHTGTEPIPTFDLRKCLSNAINARHFLATWWTESALNSSASNWNVSTFLPS